MKKLSDYKGEEAIDLWADLLDPFIEIVGDKKVAGMLRSKKPPVIVAREIIKSYKPQVEQILLRIDDTPLNGLNILIRLVSVLSEIGHDPTIQSFFVSVPEEKKEETSSGNVTENIEENETSDSSSDM